jgi:hypothetical protein
MKSKNNKLKFIHTGKTSLKKKQSSVPDLMKQHLEKLMNEGTITNFSITQEMESPLTTIHIDGIIQEIKM